MIEYEFGLNLASNFESLFGDVHPRISVTAEQLIPVQIAMFSLGQFALLVSYSQASTLQCPQPICALLNPRFLPTRTTEKYPRAAQQAIPNAT